MDPKLARKLGLVSTICFIGLGGMPHERVVFEEKKDEGGGGGGGGEKKLEFTQAELDAMFTDRTKKATAETAELKKQLADLAKAQKELQDKNDELEQKGKSAEEKARMSAEKAAKQIESDKAAAIKERDEAKAIAESAQKSLKAHVVGSQISQALVVAKVLPDGLKHALPAFLADIETDSDDAHKITAVRLGGVAQKDLASAAVEWLKANPIFAPSTGGTGSRPNNGGLGGAPLAERPVSELMKGAVDEVAANR